MLLFAITREQHQGFNDALLSWKHQSFRIAIALLPYPPVGDNWPVCEKVINHFGCPKDPSQWSNSYTWAGSDKSPIYQGGSHRPG
jgi:hypothetical protein